MGSLFCTLPSSWYNYFGVISFILIIGFALFQPDYRKMLKQYFRSMDIIKLPEVKRSREIFFAVLTSFLLWMIFEKISNSC